jgi:transposase
MEEVLDLYAQAPDPQRPVVCFDEAGKELRSDVQPPLPPKPGQPLREDYEYEHEGSANMFMLLCPAQGWRHVEVSERRTYADFAGQMKALVDEHFPTAEKIRVVMDNLNTHSKAALYETFAPQEAKRIADRLEFVYTPKHASWLNMAEMEWSVLMRQCLDRRIGDFQTLRREIAAWEKGRNVNGVKIEWNFRVADARVKMSHLYPVKHL